MGFLLCRRFSRGLHMALKLKSTTTYNLFVRFSYVVKRQANLDDKKGKEG